MSKNNKKVVKSNTVLTAPNSKRLFAYLIDQIIIFISTGIIMALLGITELSASSIPSLFAIVGDEKYLETTNFNLKYFFMLTSIFIADYIELFPQVQNTFESMSIRDQIVIDFYNTSLRGLEFSINEPWKVAE